MHKKMTRVMQNCIGAIDGTHVFCKPPKGKAKNFWGRKGGHTMNIIAVVDFNLCFTFVAAGYEGSMHDYKIFKDVVYGPKKDRFPHPEPGNRQFIVCIFLFLGKNIVPCIFGVTFHCVFHMQISTTWWTQGTPIDQGIWHHTKGIGTT